MLGKLIAAFAVLLLLSRGGVSQCFSESSCEGDVISSSDLCDCCVNQNGLSFHDGSTCYPCIVHGFPQPVYTVSEEGHVDIVFAINSETGLGTLVISGSIDTKEAGTASTTDFQGIASSTVTLSSTTPTTSIRLFANNDEITLEYEDKVELMFTPADTRLIPGVEGNNECIRTSAIVCITDNDPLEINFVESDYSIMEGSDTLSSTISLQFRYNQNPFSVELCPMTVDAAEVKYNLREFINSDTITANSRATLDPPDPDFSDKCITIIIPAGRRTFEVHTFFTVNDDDIDEDEQSFVIVAEILDVPDNISCFQTHEGGTICFGSRGATEIRITDNDPMVIGFTQKIQTVCECDDPTLELLPINIEVAATTTAERDHPMIFRLQSGGTATVEPIGSDENLFFDALFGTRAQPGAPIQEEFLAVIQSLPTDIRNDLRPEEEECFTIRIFPVDVPGRRELFSCNEDEDEDGSSGSGSGEANYFCATTICIEDDDVPFKVAFVKTTYTVDESVGAVNVCVHLIQPTLDIFDETVNLFVIDDNSSPYIPSDAPLATPDAPNFLSQYPMEEETDFAQQTRPINVIDDIIINNLTRTICYLQPIYDDTDFEPDEYAGLTLGVNQDRTTVLTLVEPMYDYAAILILDNDHIPITVGYNPVFYTTTEGQGSVVLNITIFDPPTWGTPRPFTLVVNTQDGTARAGPSDNDYVAVSGEIVQFNVGDTFQTHTIIINDDMECENMPNEEFFSNITFNSGVQPINMINPQAIVTIDDSGEAECIDSPDLVNDTVTGDPLMTVPIYTTPENTLCYEVHGETDQTFNLISDNCVAVNAHYTRAVANNPNITLNVINTIGVRAVATDDTCVNISVNLEGCVAMVNDQPGSVPYQRNGISVRKYNNRVRIVVPNCGETDLVMWVFCTSGNTADPKTNIYYNFDFLRFVVRRGLNLNERSHGLIGQFWNIRIDVQEHLGLFNGNIRSDDYNITVRYPGSSPRSFVAIQSSVTWEFEKKPCLYVGNSQAGPLGEDVDPNDSVIEGTYKDYMVESIYSPNFKFAHIDENNCMTK